MAADFEILLVYACDELVFSLRLDFFKLKSIRLVTTPSLLIRLRTLRRGTTRSSVEPSTDPETSGSPTEVRSTHRSREMDSNFQYAGAVNLVVGPFGWVVLCDWVRSGRGASGTARYQRRGWAILAAGLGAAHRPSDPLVRSIGLDPK